MSKHHLALVSALALWLFSKGASAAGLFGLVTDAHGRPIPNAQVKIVGAGSDVTTSSGEFRIDLTPSSVGRRVTVAVSKEGFASTGSMSFIVPADPKVDPVHLVLRPVSVAQPRI